MNRSGKAGCGTLVIGVLLLLIAIGLVKSVIDPEKPATTKQVDTNPSVQTPSEPVAKIAASQALAPDSPPIPAEDPADVPLTAYQKANIAVFKAAASVMLKDGEIANVDYEKGRMWINVVSWDNETKGWKESVIQGLYVASFGNARYKKATIYANNGYEELGHYVGVEGPTIIR